MCTPSLEIATDVPALHEAAASSLNSVAARPELPPSAGLSVTVTGPVCQPGGASSVVTGTWVSSRTVADRVSSTWPSVSVER